MMRIATRLPNWTNKEMIVHAHQIVAREMLSRSNANESDGRHSSLPFHLVCLLTTVFLLLASGDQTSDRVELNCCMLSVIDL
jgi:hypothetical protein